jgi:hypothetical protein
VSSKVHFCDEEQIGLLEDELCAEQFNGLLEKGKRALILWRGGGLWLLFNRILKIRGNKKKTTRKLNSTKM